MSPISESGIMIRHDLRPGDLGQIIWLHGNHYADEYGFDHTFEAYVAESLADFGIRADPERDRIWIAEHDSKIVGSIGIVGRKDGTAQLRWLLVHPDARGCGLGKHLVADSLAFSRSAGYQSVYLWTVHVLPTASHLYTNAGFQLTEEKDLTPLWGTMLREQRYDFALL